MTLGCEHEGLAAVNVCGVDVDVDGMILLDDSAGNGFGTVVKLKVFVVERRLDLQAQGVIMFAVCADDLGISAGQVRSWGLHFVA